MGDNTGRYPAEKNTCPFPEDTNCELNMRGSIFNIPNIITFCRIIVTPVLFILLLHSPGKIMSFCAAVIFVLASITDFLDGYLARRMNQVTSLGKFLDPLADKLLVGVALIMMIPLGRVPPWVVALIVGREILVTSLRVVAIREGMTIEATRMAKNKTAFQIVAVVGLLIHYEYKLGWGFLRFSVDFHIIGLIVLYIALFITIWTGADYFYKFFRKISKL
jgi:CDP-diacylglycerol--glycerol-3-phosphate 3-phosphatidyltransferase